MSILLTDDEVAAAAAHLGVSWPSPLATIQLDADELTRAAQRGLRSLLVRGLVATGTGQVVIEPEVAEFVRVVGVSALAALTYVAPAGRENDLAGNANYLYATAGSETAVLDLVTSAGIHDISLVAYADGVALIVALAKNAFEHGIKGGDGESAALVVAGYDPAKGLLRVSPGLVQSGSLNAEQSAFVPSRTEARWDDGLVLGLLVGGES